MTNEIARMIRKRATERGHGRRARALWVRLALGLPALALPAGAGAVGELAYDGCVSADGSGATCVDISGAGTPLEAATDVAVGPNGASVYVTFYRGTISHLFQPGPGPDRVGRLRVVPSLPKSHAALRRRAERAEAGLARARRVIEVQGNVSALLGELLEPRGATTSTER